MDPFTVQFPILPISKTQFRLSLILLSRHLNHHILTHHPTLILTLTQISQFLTHFPNLKNSDIETPDEFANSEPSPSTFSQPPFRPIHSQSQNYSPSTISLLSQITPTYSPFTNERSNNNSPETTQISSELNNLITFQQQIQHPHTLTIHQLSSTITSSNPPTPTPSSDYTRSLAQSSTSIQSS